MVLKVALVLLLFCSSAFATPLSYVTDSSGVENFALNSLSDSRTRQDVWGLSLADTFADLPSGELHLLARTISCLSGTNCANAGIIGSVGFGDRVTITSTFAGTLAASLLLTIEGSIVNPIFPSQAQRLDTDFSADSGRGFTSAFERRTYVSPGPYEETLRLDFLVSSANPFFDFDVSMQFRSGTPGGIVDFGNTARLSLLLPSGTTWISDSGVLLSNGPSAEAVPEPATSTFFLIGLAVVAAMARRRSRH